MIRDAHSNALIEVDRTALDKYRREKQRIKQINELRKDVADLKQTVANICKIIDKIVEEK
jgi:hypothetical protein